jgi:glycerol-3-phosphate dehydrogenase (NAD(P)+)
VIGVEMAGALKNVYAIAVGMGYSVGIGENTRAMVMTRAVREMSKLGEAAGGHRDTFAGLAGMGDLFVTCTSQRSRNRHVGEQLADSYGIAMPIAREVDGVINQGATPEDAYRGLAAETPGHEVHGAGF